MAVEKQKNEKPAKSNWPLALCRLLAISVITISMLCLVAFLRLFIRSRAGRMKLGSRMAHRGERWLCAVIGYRVRVKGNLPPEGSLLAPNHSGYCDIIGLGSALPCFFAAKGEMGQWPLLGAVLRVMEQVFVVRRASRNMKQTSEEIQERLDEGHHVVLFLEGTSFDNRTVLPFRSSFLQPVIECGALVVPVAIRWSAKDPRIDPAEDVAYWRDEPSMGAHAWRHLGLRGICVDIEFGTPVMTADRNRKELALELRASVIEMGSFSGEASLELKKSNTKAV